MRRLKVLLLYAVSEETATYSYQVGWPRHFLQHPGFRCVPVNVLDRRLWARVRSHLTVRAGGFDAVVILHSVFSNACMLGERLLATVAAWRRPTAYFIGNEYKLIPEKMQFCEQLGVSLLVTMNPSPAAQALYRRRLGCEVMCLPSGGLDTRLFQPVRGWANRDIDIGYRAMDAPLYLGHDERPRIAEAFQRLAPAAGFRVDISLDPARRLAGAAWASFLNCCRSQLGTEAGGDYFELTDETRLKVNAYAREHPSVAIEEVKKRFFAEYRDPVPVRTISGRHVEAAGTKTVQILFPGSYNNYFEPGVHYVPVAKDFADVNEVFRKLRDAAYCAKISDNAYEVARQELTYEKLIDRFHARFVTIVSG